VGGGLAYESWWLTGEGWVTGVWPPIIAEPMLDD